jgi:tetratricopeptide (TPR) repeat protein
MTKIFLLIVLTGLLCLRAGVGAAGEAAWERYNQAGVSAYQRGDYAEATKQFEAALKEAQDFGEQDPRLATSLNNLAGLYYFQGRYGETEPLFKRALAIYEKALGPEHPQVAESLNNLAVLYYGQGRYGEAEPLYKRALAIYEKALGPEHPHVATSLNNLAGLYYFQGRYGEAEPLYKGT